MYLLVIKEINITVKVAFLHREHKNILLILLLYFDLSNIVKAGVLLVMEYF